MGRAALPKFSEIQLFAQFVDRIHPSSSDFLPYLDFLAILIKRFCQSACPIYVIGITELLISHGRVSCNADIPKSLLSEFHYEMEGRRWFLYKNMS